MKIKKSILWYVICIILFTFLIGYIIFEHRWVAEISTYYNTSLLADDDLGQGVYMVFVGVDRLVVYGIVIALGFVMCLLKFRWEEYFIQALFLTSFWMRMYRIYVEYSKKWYRLNEYNHRLNYHLVILFVIIAWAFYLYLITIKDFNEQGLLDTFIKSLCSALICGLIVFFGFSLLADHI